MISGHGCFKEYLHRFKHEPSPYCDHCGTGSIEDSEHALFVCPLYARNRAEAKTTTVCNLTAGNLISCMLENQSKWDAIANMASRTESTHRGFCEASQKAYGAAIYLRVEVGHNIMTRLLTAKTRVATVKTESLPRLELCGALLLSEIIVANMPISNSDIFC